MRATVVVFPGSNCDRDVYRALEETPGVEVTTTWHDDAAFPCEIDLVVLPGGFSFGDYLRPGAMAARSPIMAEVKRHADRGGFVLGICNGFQVLTESRLLPGTLLSNQSTRFICRPCLLRVERNDTPFTSAYSQGQVVQFPIAHADGRFFLPEEELRELERRKQVVFRYCDTAGVSGENVSPNGAARNIAGIVNDRGNVLGLMPHPERSSNPQLGGNDGQGIWKSILAWSLNEAKRSGPHGF